MKTKIALLSFLLLAFAIISCKPETAIESLVTQTPVATRPSTRTPIPTLEVFSPPAVTPYPTASAIKANAVAFIAENSLWTANVDGSGERKLTDIEENVQWVSANLLQWSPDGKWIGYISGDDLWVISPDGTVKRELLSISGANQDRIVSYSWSPDGSRVAYIEKVKGTLVSRSLDLRTSKISGLSDTSQLSLSWSPDGSYILLNTEMSMTIFGVAAGRAVKQIRVECPILHGGPIWSPDSRWFYHLGYANGAYGLWICLGGLDGFIWQITDIGSVVSPPVWDTSGKYLYFVIGEMDLDNGPNLFTNQRLVRYDVDARKLETILSLDGDGPTGWLWSVAVSPNGQLLELYTYVNHENAAHPGDSSRPKLDKFIVLDLRSLSTAKFSIELAGDIEGRYPFSVWLTDDQRIIFFVRDLVHGPFGIMYDDYGSFYSLDVRTGEVSLFSGDHAVQNAIISPVAGFASK